MRLLLTLVFLLVSFSAQAGNYQYNINATYYNSATDSCNAYASLYKPQYASIINIVAYRTSSNTFQCSFQGKGSDGSTAYLGGIIHETGTACPAGSTYNSSLGQCDAPVNKCLAAAGATAKSYKVSSLTDTPPQTISINGCEASFSGVMICRNTTAGAYVCTGDATITGNQLDPHSGITAGECTGSSCTDGQPQPTNTKQDCIYAADGSGKSSCTAVSQNSTPGTTQCGSVNGAWTCVESPKSASTTSTLYSEKTDTSNTDGTVTTVKDNTLTNVKCDGVNNCTTSVTNSKGSTTTDSSGKPTSGSSTCTGSSCNGSGETTNPDDPPKPDTSIPSVTPIKQPDKGSFDGEEDKWQSKIDASKVDLENAISKLKGTFSPITGINLSSAGGRLYCPPPVVVMNTTLSFCLDQYADKLSWIASAIYVVCAIIALYIIFG